ncbi:hypothetical protein J2752_001135 [Halarchaeum rubridurum]|uniref:DUF8120 domain-containing protein n=1 Tax=Halarchaeum rubridurum TaxID=489911 RepID=A0A830FY85_9EURY|nr:hypothetical protein [Halarchaeum rubridurum]MBP1954254.1 hypothetical protein [Halarchaeum rubridurum]GGM58555.1 hypothetical protein GCM10009017_05880 [Halarchaeum rubridurum]
MPSLSPRRYRFLDRVTKLLGLVLVTVALVPGTLHGPLRIVCGLFGLCLGVATVFVEPDVEADAGD